MKRKLELGKTKKVYRKNILKHNIKKATRLSGKTTEKVLNKYIEFIFSNSFFKTKKFYFNLAVSVFLIAGVLFFFNNAKTVYGSFVTAAYENNDYYYEEANIHFETTFQKEESAQSLSNTYSPTKLYSNVKSRDKRAYVLDLYFKANDSPLYGTGDLFVKACDKYGAPKDCITTVAIARNETFLCKYHNSAAMHNCWGFGGGGTDRWTFTSFPEAIDIVTNLLVNSYGNQYMIDPSKMEKVFCGPTPECVGWGNNIKYFMAEIDSFSEANGFGKLTSLR